jgi:uncharacterized membrane protein
MRQFLRLLVWLVAAIFCGIATVVLAYISTLVGSHISHFSIESHAARSWLYGSMVLFAVLSCAFLTYVGYKMVKGDL